MFRLAPPAPLRLSHKNLDPLSHLLLAGNIQPKLFDLLIPDLAPSDGRSAPAQGASLSDLSSFIAQAGRACSRAALPGSTGYKQDVMRWWGWEGLKVLMTNPNIRRGRTGILPDSGPDIEPGSLTPVREISRDG